MENKKFEQLIDLIINENEEQARELFHEIVVEKSREIYENIMDEEMMEEGAHQEVEEGMHDDMGEGEMVGEVGDLLDEINVEEAGGMTEEEEDLEVIDLDATDDMDAGDADMGGEEASLDSIEDKLETLDDKLDKLMAEFEKDMQGDEGEEVEDEEEEEVEVAEAAEEDMDEEVMEAVQLKKVPGLYNNKIGGDNGANTKSPTLHEPKVKAAGVNPVKFSGHDESVPTGPKGPSNYGSKGEKEVQGAGKFKNVPGQDNFKEKGDSAPKPVTSQASGVNNKSVVAKG